MTDDNVILEILRGIQADLATVKADVGTVKVDLGALQRQANSHARTLDVLRQTCG
jgi:hypothetical protein